MNFRCTDADSTDLATVGVNWEPGGSARRWAQGDFDGDGDIDSSDLAALGLNWDPGGLAVGPLTQTPEPATVGLMVLGLAGLFATQRNRGK